MNIEDDPRFISKEYYEFHIIRAFLKKDLMKFYKLNSYETESLILSNLVGEYKYDIARIFWNDRIKFNLS